MATILIVDDAKFMRLTLAAIIKKGNHQIVGEAESGKEAIELYEKYKPDLVTMDVTMPLMNGIEATKAIRNKNPNAKIIMCSAMGQQKVVRESIEAGAKDFIIKPFEENGVIDTINRVLNY